MQIIHKPDEEILKIWGSGKVQHTTYRLLTYLLRTDTPRGTLLHNGITGELVLLEETERQGLDTLPCAYAPWMDALIDAHFLVKAEADDRKNADSLRRTLQVLDTEKGITGYTILPTTHCNAHCFYCYECNVQHENMSDETADALVCFMAEHCANKPIHIGWFGGEPLVGIRQIDRICGMLKERQLAFSSSMISNGYLFDEANIQRAKEEWLLKKVQITLDGTEKIYNETKAYKAAVGSPYQRVLENIGLLLQNGIRVHIRLNLGIHNADDLHLLVEELAERFPDKSHLSVYSHLLFDDCGFDATHFSAEETAVLYRKKEKLDARIFALSLGTAGSKLPRLRRNSCMADNGHTVVVLPSGKFGKCEHYTDSHLVGSLTEGITDKAMLAQFRARATFPACDTCPLYPNCIKLQLCEPNHICNEAMVQETVSNMVRAMRRLCEKHFTADDLQPDGEGLPEC